MRITAWMLSVGLLSGMLAGCSTPRFGLSKSEPPTSKPEERVKYGNPWKKEKPEAEIAGSKSGSNGLPSDLADQLAKSRAASAKPNASLTDTLKRAAAAESRGDLDAARAAYLEVVALQPNHVEAHHRLGVIADMNQDPQTADDHYARAYAANPRDADLLSDMGYSLYLRGRFDAAELKLKEALEQDQNHRSAQNNLGLLYGKQGKYDQALAMFRQTGTENEAQRNIAALFPKGRPDDAKMAQNPGGGTNPAAQAAAPPMPSDIDQRFAAAPRDNTAANNASATPPWVQPLAGNGTEMSRNPGMGANSGGNSSAVAQNGINWGAGNANPQNPLGNSPMSGAGPGQGLWGPPPGNVQAPATGQTSNAGDFWQGGLADRSTIPYPQPNRQNPGVADPYARGAGNTPNPAFSNSQNMAQNPMAANGAWPATSAGGNGTPGNWANPESGIQPATFVDRGMNGGPWNSGPSAGTSSAGPSSALDNSRLAAQMALASGPGTMFSPFGSGQPQNQGTASPWNGPGSSSFNTQFAPSEPPGQSAPWGAAPNPTAEQANPVNPWAGNAFASGPFPQGNGGQPTNPWQPPSGQPPAAAPPGPAQSLAPPSPWNDLQPTPTWPQSWPSSERPSFEPTRPAESPSGQPYGTLPQWPSTGMPNAGMGGNGSAGMPVVTPGPTTTNLPTMSPGTAVTPSMQSAPGATTFPNWPHAPTRP
ncbi:MAG: tetratricopeptide repeat protein [Planctomycetaceae bacterium]|nr:tetratricopeptide repeat protein [Planctomycetaceae bacterium]